MSYHVKKTRNILLPMQVSAQCHAACERLLIAIKAEERQAPASSASDAGRPKSAGTALGRACLGDFSHAHLCHRCYDHLGDAHAASNGEILLAEIDEQNLDFAAVIAVDRAGRIEAGDAVLEGEA